MAHFTLVTLVRWTLSLRKQSRSFISLLTPVTSVNKNNKRDNMNASEVPVPHLAIANTGPLYHVEKIVLNQVAAIETWFRREWKKTPAP